MIKSVSPLPYNLGSLYLVHTLIMVYMSAGLMDLLNLCQVFVIRSVSLLPRLTIFGPFIDHGGYMSAGHVSPDLDLIFIVF